MTQLRPFVLSAIFAQNRTLPGVGEGVSKQLERLCGSRVLDLLWHLPSGVIERRLATRREQLVFDRDIALSVRVESHQPPESSLSNLPYEIRCAIPNLGWVTLKYFKPKNVTYDYFRFLAKKFVVGQDYIVAEKLTEYNGGWQMVAPLAVPLSEQAEMIGWHPVYPLTKGLTENRLKKIITAALAKTPALPEWLRPEFLSQQGWHPWRESLLRLHHPEAEDDLGPQSPWRQRLAFDELLAQQLALVLIRHAQRSRHSRALVGNGRIRQKILAALPFRLTAGQEAVVAEITQDLGKPFRMQRLLQGDVGSGKTIVALLAMVTAVESGVQAALIAPTELLARQHSETLAAYCFGSGLTIVTLTGRDKSAERARLLAMIESGEAQMVIGTHSLLSESVRFHDLGLAVIDEQHRFGVEQRAALSTKTSQSKAGRIDLLVMTATPIPRSLALTSYGDLEVSRLTEPPHGRQPIATLAVPLDRLSELVAALHRAIALGEQAYWVCPLVEESEISDLTAVETRAESLREQFGEQVGLLHGRMKPEERDEIMARFSAQRLKILVATTVIEVGVDVPNATIMIIEQAERFGLAQLHQLRGRVGRGTAASHCFLLYSPPLGQVAEQRLRAIRGSQDGFWIAEQDLRLRGAGEVLGTKQSGIPDYRIADLSSDSDLIEAAQREASAIMNRNPRLEGEDGAALRTLLYLFEHDSSIRFLAAG
ncbi:MAG: ATP-dependent DNA helicase RecG [Alphaproteobacteria bacterium]|nr:ATP-dependent DNA helicase RecG [Alphaproteobacteria bacterium]